MTFPGLRVLAVACWIAGAAQAAIVPRVTLTTSTDLATFGQAVTLTAFISSTQATGQVSFFDGPILLGTSPVGAIAAGQAVINPILPVGSHSLRAYYLGDINFTPNNSPPVSQVVFAFPQKGFVNGSTFSAGGSPLLIVTADFNNDGHTDLVTAAAGGVQVSYGDGAGNFGQSLSYAAGSTPIGIAVADFNGDGFADIAVVARDSGSLTILLNQSGQQFVTLTSFTFTNQLYAVAAADFNGDGRADLVVSGAGILGIMLGRGDGTFVSPLNYSAAGTAFRSVAIGDFNGDGIPDLAAAELNTSKVYILTGVGDGTFGKAVGYSTGNLPVSVVVTDVDGDGLDDLVTANDGAGNVSVLRGKGDGTFQASKDYAVGSQPYSVVAGDFNGDGKLDLAVANLVGQSALSILIGAGDGTFAAAAPYNVGFVGGVAAAVGDFNSDGRSDLAMAFNTGRGQIVLGVAANLVPTPAINTAGIVNGASFKAPIAPGFLGSLFGTNLAAASGAALAVPLPVELNGVSISIGGYLAPLIVVSPAQINFQLPWELLGQSQAVAVVAVNGSLSATQTISLRANSPAIFALNSQGSGQGAVQIANTAIYAAPADSVPGSQARPAIRGEYLTIYCTGLGDVSNRPADGAPALSDPLSSAVATPTVSIGGVDAPVSFAGLSPGFVGLYQVNALVPAGALSGSQVPLVIGQSGLASNIVSIAVQ